jgi:rubredoxin
MDYVGFLSINPAEKETISCIICDFTIEVHEDIALAAGWKKNIREDWTCPDCIREQREQEEDGD